MELIKHRTVQIHFPVKKKLHTDILEQKYGPIHAVVLRHDRALKNKKKTERTREARLVDKNNILRTYALTFLTYDTNNKELVKIDDEIRQGGLIGKVFRKHGYIIKKNVIDVFIAPIPLWMKKDFAVKVKRAKYRMSEFYAKKKNLSPVIYGIVLEIYSPDFKDPKEGINHIDRAQINPLIKNLITVGMSDEDIWKRLDKASDVNEWEDLQDKYKKARKRSQPVVQSLHKKVLKHLEGNR
ncbi:MAG: hypothetical protein WCV92_00830 [Candidatus Buchananbacteria bacterium]